MFAYIRGTVKFPRLQSPSMPDWAKETNGEYSTNITPDANSMSIIPTLGLRNVPKVGEDGKVSYSFKAPVQNKWTKETYPAPEVAMEDGSPVNGTIGDGSELTLKLLVESGTNKAKQKWTRSRIVGARVHKLVEYKPVEVGATTTVASGTAQPITAQPTLASGGMPW